ncbi:sensor histidine kinase [Staphylococcus americanisciuri]|uniref:histidine kinase n=1 Tax=Staphylococcus americanisciuri TaxID=2973940 RepID=A0ABT2F3G8_9STAP|nr:HAMP domain-containing sensor histidine kinase [Staphylococcus americanisciuri]MCS4486920.1 HAMP domain-containing histidine kinase [Staphylococcus americanisciuri]
MKNRSLRKLFIFNTIKIVIMTLISIVISILLWVLWVNIYPRDYYERIHYENIKKEVEKNKDLIRRNEEIKIKQEDSKFIYAIYYKNKLIKNSKGYGIKSHKELEKIGTSNSFVDKNIKYKVEILDNEIKIIAIYPAFSTGNMYVDKFNSIAQNLLLITPVFWFTVFLVYYTSRLYREISSNFYEVTSYLKYIEKGIFDKNLREFKEEEFQELANRINLMKDKLKILLDKQVEKIEVQNNLFSSVAHDIKTPLTIISAETEMIMLSECQNINIQSRSNIILSEISRIDNLLTELLTISKLNLHNYSSTIEPINIQDVIFYQLKEFQSLIEKKNAQVKFLYSNENYYVNGDNMMLNRVLQNIISNALEHIDVSGELQIDLKSYDNKISLQIANTGSQFPDDYLRQEFIPFYSKKNERDKNHFGLGLYMSNIMLKKMNSELFIENKENKACVTIFFRGENNPENKR